MLSTYKLWAAATTHPQWTAGLQNYIVARKPTTHRELEVLVNQYNARK